MMRLLKYALLILLSFSIAACYNMRVVAEDRDAVQLATTGKADGLRVGDRLLITTNNGEQVKIRARALEPDAILPRAARPPSPRTPIIPAAIVLALTGKWR